MSEPTSNEDRHVTRSLRNNLLPYLTKVAYGSTPFITTFVLIHLAAPAAANFGGSALSSQTMLLGREYYQTNFGETYLVLGPIAVHTLAGVAKRLLSIRGTPPRRLTSILSWTGYTTLLLFLPIHFMTHRVDPTSTSAAISAVGPAELDYEFVKLGLQKWPIRSWFLYTGLVSSVVLHMVDGTTIVWNAWIKDSFIGKLSWKTPGDPQRKRKLKFVKYLAGVVLPVLSGLYVISNEPSMIFASMSKRFEAVFRESWVYN
ncbi:hypothetical protein BDZ94DRAFT_1216293 [Collybia nuda]|uniref:Mitochondrial adapter protein MCP1 transmembrane domain-containing protein n=1 Tax=Collybia nuda TaxID=64659 RepID=A0A9P5Y9H1_9AGAR|nr:hypothetical protein BDZ94DRAFT_1216293 [Collybia nuda]